MRMTADEIATAYRALDAANDADPTTVFFGGADRPKATLQGERATHWIHILTEAPSDAVLLAARGHHLLRFARPRADYPDGRAGYLKWRRDAKVAHAEALTSLLHPLGVNADVLHRAGELIQRIGLGTDPETQLIEDAACLVFCETDLDPLLARLGPDTTAAAVAKTVKKMSAEAIALIPAAVPVGPAADFLGLADTAGDAES